MIRPPRGNYLKYSHKTNQILFYNEFQVTFTTFYWDQQQRSIAEIVGIKPTYSDTHIGHILSFHQSGGPGSEQVIGSLKGTHLYILRYIQHIEVESNCSGTSNREELCLSSVKSRKEGPLSRFQRVKTEFFFVLLLCSFVPCVVFNGPDFCSAHLFQCHIRVSHSSVFVSCPS